MREDLDCVVEPGVTRKQLNEHLRDQGLFFPIDPGADASLGGMAATRCSGTNAVRYGTMKDNVLALKVVLRQRRADDDRAARQEVVGRLRSHPPAGRLGRHARRDHRADAASSPASRRRSPAGVCPFPSVEAACNAAIVTIQSGIPVARIELLDELQVKATNLYSKLTLPEAPMLFVEFHGSPAGVAEQSRALRRDRGAISAAARSIGRPSPRTAPGSGRRATTPIGRGGHCARARRRWRPTSACRSRGSPNASPRPSATSPSAGWWRRSSAMSATAISISRCWSTWPTPTRSRRAKALCERLVERALAMDGTCTGEHGVGQGKMKYLAGRARRAGARRHARRSSGRSTRDDIMNPGKIVPLG